MGFCRQLLFLSCILINLVCLSIAQLPDFNVSSCITESGNYADNGTYHKNLNSLLSSLPSNTNEDGFYNASAGQNSDRVEAMVLCRGDTDLENCRRCIHNSISKLPQLCPNNKEAIGWYDQCYLLYTNKSIVGDTVSKSPFLLQANGNNISTDDQFNQQFNQQVRELLEDLRLWAAAGRRRKVAAGNTTWPAFGSIYAMTQCTPVLSEEECSDCLEEIFGQIPQFANGKQGFKYLSPSCNFRFEIYPFFKDVPPPVTPAQLSNFVAYSCITESGNYTINGTYHTNLNTLLSSLSSNINKYGFYNATEGQNSDKVEAMVLCRGDTNLETCRSCINNSTTKLTKLCPSYKEAIGWYDQCFLWYTTKSIVGNTVSKSPTIYLWNTTDVPNIDQFNQQLRNLLETLRSQAAAGDRRKFATGNTTRPDFGYIFALTQCTPILSEKECNDCLVDAIGQIPQCCEGKQSGWVLQPSCNFRFQISPFFGDIPTDVPPSATPGKDDNTTRTVIIIAIPIVTFLVVIIISICIFMRKKKQRKPVQNVVKHDDVDEISTVESLQYNFGTISIATDNFSDSNKLGQGGFGAVYQGRLPNGQLIAVKRLSMDSGQGELEFKNEFLLLAQLQHRNLVRLLGFSLKGSERLLIYEFVPNSSLDCFLFDPIKRPLLDWERRYKIIGGIARALLYLHEDSRLRIIHRDLKASNVLLDADMNPKISDFGMARLFVTDETQGNTSRIVGTFGYMAPEYAMHGQFSMKTDIFSFGVLVLEIVCGQKNNCFSNGESTEDLLSYAWKGWHEGTASNLVDPILRNGSGSMREMMRCIHIGLLCVQENVASRPTMASVVLMLNSSSLTLLAPLEPAFFNHSGLDPEMPQLQEHNSSVSSQSKTKSAQVLVNEVSITELYPS